MMQAVFVDGGTLSNFPIALFHNLARKPLLPTLGVQLNADRTDLQEIKSVPDLIGSMYNRWWCSQQTNTAVFCSGSLACGQRGGLRRCTRMTESYAFCVFHLAARACYWIGTSSSAIQACP